MALDVLIVEDEENIADLISEILKEAGFSTRMAMNSKDTFLAVQDKVPNAIILDVWLKGSELDGLGILEKIKERYSLLPVVVISGHGTIDSAITAIKLGAYDYVPKPLSRDKLLITLTRACEAARLRKENISFKSRFKKESEVLGSSAAVNKLRSLIEKAASNSGRVLIDGEFGCEHDTVAHLIHSKSSRSSRPIITFDPSAVSEDNILLELFGEGVKQQEGEPVKKKMCLLEVAHGSSLYIKNVNHLPSYVHCRLLNFFNGNKIQGVKQSLDVRIIASVACKSRYIVADDPISRDFYERLKVMEVSIPSLANRKDDVGFLVDHYAEQFAKANGLKKPIFSHGAITTMMQNDWPGNLLQLRNFVEKIIISLSGSDDKIVHVGMLSNDISVPSNSILEKDGVDISVMSLKVARDYFEKYYLEMQMNKFGKNISKTATFIGMERSALHRKLKRFKVGIKNCKE
ncbi:sigma-54-dependent transcriptional regulator [Candidatus Sneabacter namystus]|uniref:Putative response regulator NtrX-like n=1 Tax=Candidatus Sneabacter namystus TaxID=2601646 RepID=A0A5C0UHP0_9RICK|nr:sigma-54 dependent transcriptional regulator [Candidatus Sneabacter namystus]QEK39536.1 sigma-54-dependent Fis family transcriptional regulator [Candidatus Sneabacter namystus]